MIQICIVMFVLVSCETETIKEEKNNYEPYNFETNQKGLVQSTQKGMNSFVQMVLKTNPSCSSIPTLDQVKLGGWTFNDKFYTQRQAYKIGIPIANIDFSKNTTVYVRDYVRAKPCQCIDGVTTLKYGQVIRTVIEIEDFDASTGVDLASIAASGTLKKKKQNFYLYKDGFYNPQIDQIISNISGKVFDVENYALYQKVMSQMINLLSKPETQFSVNLIGVEVKIEDDKFLEEAPIITYTLSKIEKGKSCTEIKNYLENDSNAVKLIEKTFNALELKCDETKPYEEIRLKTKRLLQGIKVK